MIADVGPPMPFTVNVAEGVVPPPPLEAGTVMVAEYACALGGEKVTSIWQLDPTLTEAVQVPSVALNAELDEVGAPIPAA